MVVSNVFIFVTKEQKFALPYEEKSKLVFLPLML